jgi:hypothetical protein
MWASGPNKHIRVVIGAAGRSSYAPNTLCHDLRFGTRVIPILYVINFFLDKRHEVPDFKLIKPNKVSKVHYMLRHTA